jgi:hypothetical protein
MCFVKTFVQTSPRQHSRHGLVGLDFATIIVEHGKARPHRRIGCCIHCNSIVLSLTHKASNDLITATGAISTEGSRSVASVANVAMLDNELTHRLHETLRRADMAAYRTNMSLNDTQGLHS